MTIWTRLPDSAAKPALRFGFLLVAIVAILAAQSSVQTGWAQSAQTSPQTSQQTPSQGSPPIAGAMARFKPAPGGKAAPAILALDAKDQPFDATRLAGKLVVLNFWATWCAPCVKEMPSLDRLQAKLGNRGVVVVPLSLDGPTKAKVEPFFADNKLTHLPILFDHANKTFGAAGVSVLPTTIVLRDGKELGRIEGPAEWDDEDATRLLEFYLQAK